MRALLPTVDGNPDLHDIYARNWLDDGGVRANFVQSIDGATTVDGTSRGLQTPGDQAVLAVLRDLADVLVVGRATARAEQYRALRPTPRRAQARARWGLPASLPTAVVSVSLDLDLDGSLFDAADGAARTIVITVAGAPRRADVEKVADVIVAGEETLDVASAVAQLRARGLRRILTEGGAQLFAALLAADTVDELCLTTVPRLVGGGSGRLVEGNAFTGGRAMILHTLLEDDGTTFARYRVDDASRRLQPESQQPNASSPTPAADA